jgi:plastocyanin
VVVRTLGATVAAIVLGTPPALAGAPLGTPALASPTPTAETSPSSSPLRGPSAEPSPPTSREERAPRQATTSALVAARDNRFVPESITVEVGTTVVWRNEGRNPHTVTANDRAFDSDTLESGGAFQVTFEEVGAVAYYCQIHGEPGSGMTGVVRVVAAPDDPAEEGPGSGAPEALPRTGLGVLPLVLLALSLAAAGALALRVASAREGR